MAPSGPTVPEAGVIAARPAMAPVAKPRALGLPDLTFSRNIQVRAATHGEIWVTTIAMAACPPAARALPPLNPNHPTQSIAVPIIVRVRLCGSGKLVWVTLPCPEHYRRYQSGGTRRYVDDYSSGKVNHSHVSEVGTFSSQTMCAIGK